MRTRGDGNRGGRPPKFAEPRRPVTVTLPERTLRQLASIDDDRAAAIVKLADAAVAPDAAPDASLVRIVRVAPGVSVIVVGPSKWLRKIPWLRLAEVTRGRYLVTVLPGTPIESLEVALMDLIEAVPRSETHERRLLAELRALISASRREQQITKYEMLYVSPPARRRARSVAAAPSVAGAAP